MDATERAWIEGVLSAQDYLLQNLWALQLATESRPLEACDSTGAEMLRQFALPVTNKGPMDADAKHAALRHGEHHLRRFWELVRGRLQTAEL